MKRIRLKTDGSAVTTARQSALAVTLSFIFLPFLLIFWSDLTVAPEILKILWRMFYIGLLSLMVFILTGVLFSEYSPVRYLGIRKKIILFTRLFIKSGVDGGRIHSVEWQYCIKDKKIVIDLYPKGLVKDTVDIGRKLSEYLGETLLGYEESDGKARYTFGSYPKRYDGMELLGQGISTLTGGYKPMLSYEPIPVYDNVAWNFNSEALHILLLAPSGAGKTMFLNYLAGMILKRQHRLYVIDAKNSSFGALFRHSGIQVATNTQEIIELLTALVWEMEERYAKYFSTDTEGIGADFSTLKLKGHFLVFDEILSVLASADKKEKTEIERLLGQLALKGRAAGFSLLVTAQKLNASDLPKSITEQCQTRVILGSLVSDETFHQATGLYKKDAVTIYKGGVGKGYAVTPKSKGLAYIETPLMPDNTNNLKALLKELRDTVCDVGAGAAHLTIKLAEYGLKVCAVEPNDAMRANGVKRTAQFSNVSWHEGVGEHTGMGDSAFDLVTFGSSFNVCDRQLALKESVRILKPGGWFACMWNHRDLDDLLQQKIELILKKHIEDYDYGTRREDQTEVIEGSGLFGKVTYLEGAVIHEIPAEDFIEGWKSHGTVYRQSQEKFGLINDEIRSLVESVGTETVKVPYITRIWMAQSSKK